MKECDPYVLFKYLFKEYLCNSSQKHDRDAYLDNLMNVMQIKQQDNEKIDAFNVRFKALYEALLLLRHEYISESLSEDNGINYCKSNTSEINNFESLFETPTIAHKSIPSNSNAALQDIRKQVSSLKQFKKLFYFI
jgi:hypothetical protein